MNRRLAVGLFLLLGVLWGSSFVIIDIGLSFFPPVLFAALRYYIAGCAILGFAIGTTEYWKPRTSTDGIAILIVGTLIIAGHHAFLYIGEQYISGAVAAVIISLGPVLTALFAGVVLGERLTWVAGVGFGFGILGVSLVADPNPKQLFSTDVSGAAIVLVASACFALGSVLTRPLTTRMPPRSLQAWGMLFGAPLLHVFSIFRGESMGNVNWTSTAAGSLIYLGLVSGAVAFLIYFELLDELGPMEINLIGYLEPVAATLISWMVLGQLISPLTSAGFIAIFLGFTCIKRHALKQWVLSLRQTSIR